MKHALTLLCATLAFSGAAAHAQSVAPTPTATARGATVDPADPASQGLPLPALVGAAPAGEPAVSAAPRAPMPGSEVLEEGDPRLDAVIPDIVPERRTKALGPLEPRLLAQARSLEAPRTAALLRAAYPLADVTYHRGWGVSAEVLSRMLEPAPGRYSRLVKHCGLHEGSPLSVLELQTRQAREGAFAARDRRSDVPEAVGSMSPSGRYTNALRITRVGNSPPVLSLLQKPSATRITLAADEAPQTETASALLSERCAEGSLPDATLEGVLQTLFPQGGAGTGQLMLAQVALGELSSPGAMRVPGASQAPVHAHVLAHEGSVLLSAYVRAAGLGAPEAFERVLALLQAREAYPVSLQRTLLDGRGTGHARFVFDTYELVLGVHLDASGERLTLALRKP